MRLADNTVSWELTQSNYGCWLPLISFDACNCILHLLSGVLCDVLEAWKVRQAARRTGRLKVAVQTELQSLLSWQGLVESRVLT